MAISSSVHSGGRSGGKASSQGRPRWASGRVVDEDREKEADTQNRDHDVAEQDLPVAIYSHVLSEAEQIPLQKEKALESVSLTLIPEPGWRLEHQKQVKSDRQSEEDKNRRQRSEQVASQWIANPQTDMTRPGS